MSCATNGLKAAACAARNGLSRIGSKSAFYGAAERLMTAAASRLRRQKTTTPPFATTETGSPLPTLGNPELIAPLPANETPNRLCGQCGAFSDAKPGRWYHINDTYFCQDCASTAARKNGAVLTAAAQSADIGFNLMTDLPAYWSRRPVDLKAAKVQSGSVRGLSGYQVFRHGKPSGLSLIPELKSEGGQIKITDHWSVNYDRANKPVAGPFASRETAQHAAELLCNFDWTRDIDDFNPTEVAAIKAMMINFRRQSG